MADRYPIVFSQQSGLLQEIGPDDTLIADSITSTNLQVTGTISVPGGGSLDSLRLRSYGISNDPTIYTGTGAIVSTKLQVSGISTSRFAVGDCPIPNPVELRVMAVVPATDQVLTPVLSIL